MCGGRSVFVYKDITTPAEYNLCLECWSKMERMNGKQKIVNIHNDG